ncbi:MAG: hypothetical protein R2710_14900 [Acidimicrobiales bacterium]
MSGLLIAQESVTSTTVKWFIAALLLVAVLLTVLTVWYWRHTDPYRRLAEQRRAPVDRGPEPRPAPLPAQSSPSHQSPSQQEWGGTAAPSASDAAADARRRAAAGGMASGAAQFSAPGGYPTAPPTADDDLEADDWLRLTGPQALPRNDV